LAAKRWRRLRRYVGSLTDTPTNEELHEARILAKRVRYAVEATAPAAGAAASASAERIIALQTVLGEHHDAAVTREWLHRQASDGGADAFAAGQLAALELGRLRLASDRWRDAWRAASRRKDWKWLHS
jgi:CHAD domain-containing protein